MLLEQNYKISVAGLALLFGDNQHVRIPTYRKKVISSKPTCIKAIRKDGYCLIFFYDHKFKKVKCCNRLHYTV